ncbi:hypothetical protein [Streptomyces sp. NPDC006739]
MLVSTLVMPLTGAAPAHVIDGHFDAYCATGTITTQYATFAHHGAGDA